MTDIIHTYMQNKETLSVYLTPSGVYSGVAYYQFPPCVAYLRHVRQIFGALEECRWRMTDCQRLSLSANCLRPNRAGFSRLGWEDFGRKDLREMGTSWEGFKRGNLNRLGWRRSVRSCWPQEAWCCSGFSVVVVVVVVAWRTLPSVQENTKWVAPWFWSWFLDYSYLSCDIGVKSGSFQSVARLLFNHVKVT